jgi:DNA mismatch repair ATPase MutL
MANLAKPYAVIRRALALAPEGAAGEVEGDAEDEEDLEDDLLAMDARPTLKGKAQDKGKGKGKGKAEDEEEEGPLFPDLFQTPPKKSNDPQSSPSSIYPSSAIKDYSSELDFSSPPMSDTSTSKRDLEESSDDDDDEEEEERRRKKAKRSGKKERTRRYEVVGIVRRKVVFALR